MTILSHLIPDGSSWSSFWDWGYSQGGVWGGRRETTRINQPFAGGLAYTEWRDHHGNETRIPVRFEDRCKCQEPLGPVYFLSDSDDDSKDENVNNSSSNMKRKKLRSSGGASRPVLISSSDSLLNNDVIEIDLEPKSVTRSQSVKVDLSDEGLGTVPPKNLKLESRSSRRISKASKPIYVADGESDCEEEINKPSSYSVYDYLQPMLKKTGRQIDAIKGDGNCFFRALSKVIYGKQDLYMFVRQSLVKVLEKYPKKFEAFTDGPIFEHIADMKLDKTWATQTEIYAAATLLQRDVYILSPNQTNDTYSWLLFSPQFKYVTHEYEEQRLCIFGCYVTLCHTHGNHYDRVAAQKAICNCHLLPPELLGVKGSVDLTNENDIV